FGSRPCLSVAPDASLAGRFGRDVAALREAREGIVRSHGYRAEGGHALLWLLPWDGKESAALLDCDPFFIEVCRRVRLESTGSGIVARTAPSKSPRLDGKSRKGDTGDAWTPIERDDQSALTLGGTGFHYARLSDLLFSDDWAHGAAFAIRAEDGPSPWVVARAMVRGQGKTEGLHERVVPIPTRVVRRFRAPEGRASLGQLAKRRVEQARNLRLRSLKPALVAIVQGGVDDLRLDDKRVDHFLDLADALVDARFFEALFEDVDASPDEQDARWDRVLVDIGAEVLERAIGALPLPEARRYRAISAAEGRFWGSARKVLSAAFPSRSTEEVPA
ncbi:MAG: type I-E CRISPR-associated protein Cse1/CasA, partial [Polyangiaceae bacterium]|nr:type I-E CRISPR-associated protein Cse1/CasA [Polyangiaceae bacterium]